MLYLNNKLIKVSVTKPNPLDTIQRYADYKDKDNPRVST